MERVWFRLTQVEGSFRHVDEVSVSILCRKIIE